MLGSSVAPFLGEVPLLTIIYKYVELLAGKNAFL